MKDLFKRQLTRSVLEVMEKMFCLPAEENKKMIPDPEALFDISRVEVCRIGFQGEFNGMIFLVIPSDLLETMAQKILGEDGPDATGEQTHGILKEALNMIAGSTLTKMDQQAYTALAIPEIVDYNAIEAYDILAAFSTIHGALAAAVKLEAPPG